MDLNTIWFILVAVLLAGYAILDGFDLGVGILHLFIKGDNERRLALNSIGPVWDGNEVWLVTGGGALFAAFPEVYASAFSGFYTALMLLLVTLIFRAVAIEFRSKRPSPQWRQGWDLAFAAGSFGAALLMGVAFGNVAAGVPMDAEHNITAGLTGMLNPYALLVGATTVVLFAMHGAIYLVLKTEGDLQARIRTWVRPLIIWFVICYGLTTMATLLWHPHLAERMRAEPVWFLVPILTMLSVANVPREIFHGREFRAFLSSSAAIGLLVTLIGVGLYPNLLLATNDPAHSLTIVNAASSQKTLWIMLIIALIGVPLVLAYTAGIYWIFRGKAKIDKTSY
ncbi:MAG: cytochrome d ubiquinol oxidase subunit II [Planctomycetes bacterium]|nr:cytochrome d ubiquinol oxidase subunit II [Planctomycetota bacterium]